MDKAYYREMWEETRDELKLVDEENKDLKAENARIKADFSQMTAWGRGLESDLSRANVELMLVKAELAKSEEHNEALCERMQDLNSELFSASNINGKMHMKRVHDLNEMGGLCEENARLKAEVERLTQLNATISLRYDATKSMLDGCAKEIEEMEAEVERLTSDLQMEKENEDRLVREWQRANNEVYGLQRQVAALIDDQTRLKAEVERLTAFTTRTIIPNEELQAQVERITSDYNRLLVHCNALEQDIEDSKK